MDIDFANLQRQYQEYKDDINFRIQKVLNNSNYILGSEVYDLEKALGDFTGAKYALSCSSGTDSLLLSMLSIDLKPGDEVITSPFTFISTAEAISRLNAKPVFVDIEKDTFNIDSNKIESAITSKTKAIIPVSLFGQPADLNVIELIANKYNLKVIVDGAQSFGSTLNKITDSNLGDLSITSFFPAKPLGCYGDGGAIFTNNVDYFEKIKMLRVHGQNQKYRHKYIGIGGRLDTIQASILLAKIPFFDQELVERSYVAEIYSKSLYKYFSIPVISSDRTSSWAQYTIRTENRDHIKQKLKEKGIPTAIYYPTPLHLQECYKDLRYKIGDFPEAELASKEVLSLPINAFMRNEIEYIVSNLIDLA
ncbi:DegT/DnrJ/EryC1/StrS family aminotransferase [Pseudothioglobus sp. nBUS_23]|uniref:DegT/DnrJ/EryC1/StrS family aminotransferase n=1 Tax=Pseudothioglobus sp. nBUS_23 TaxID=3395318 RepID=UPI003EB95686